MIEKYKIETTRVESTNTRTKVYFNGIKVGSVNIYKSYKDLIESQEKIIKSHCGIEKVVTTFNYKP